MSSKAHHTHVYFCNGSKRGKSPQRKGKADELIFRSLSMFFYTQNYYVETPTSRGTSFDPSEARFQNMLIVFTFYLDKSNIRDPGYRQEILKCLLRHQNIVFINNTFMKPDSILLKFRRSTSWEKDQLKALLHRCIEISKECYEEAIFNLIREIKALKLRREEKQQTVGRQPSMMLRKCSSASRLLDSVKLEEKTKGRQALSQGESGKGNPISFFRKISKRRPNDKNTRAPFWITKRYQSGEGNKSFLFGNFSGTLKRRSKKSDEQETTVSNESPNKETELDMSGNTVQALNTGTVAHSGVFEIRGTEVNLEKRLTKRPWANWKSKTTFKGQSPTDLERLSVPNARNATVKDGNKLRAFFGIQSLPKSAPSSPLSSSENTSSDGNPITNDVESGHDIIRVGPLTRSDSCQSLPHITVTHSAGPGNVEGSDSFLDTVDFLPRVSCLDDFEHFSKYAIYRPERSRRRSSQRFLIIRYPEDLSLLQKRDSSSELISSACSSPNPYDALELTAGYESESPLQSPETRRSIYPQPVPAFPVESCFPPVDIPKTVQSV